MALVTMKELLERAKNNHRGIGAFSVGNMEMVKGAIQAAEELDTPIILQIAEVRLKHSPLALMGPMMIQAAKEAKVDVAVHLDHGLTMEMVEKALELGFTSVMFDSSTYPFEENIERTAKVAELAKKYGATVEAELGLIGGSDAHGNYPVAPKLAFDVLEQIHDKTGIPLVLHGGSGITDADFRKAIELGIVKVNIATASFNRLTKHAEEYLKSEGVHNYFDLNVAMVQGTYENVRHHIEVFNCEMPLDEVDA